MIGSIDNGRLVQARFGDFDGRAGMIERGGRIQIAFFGDFRRMRAVREGTIDDAPHRVIEIASSEYIKGMVVLTVAPVEPSEGA